MLKRKLFGSVAWSALAAGLVWLAVSSAERADSVLAAKVAAAEAKADAAARRAAELAEYADRLIDLPEDGHAWHVTVFTHDPPTASERQLVSWFTSDPQLAQLKGQTHFHHYTPASSVYSRYSALTAGGLPAVAVQDAAGAVVYKAGGAGAPKAPWPLAKGIKDCILAHCPHLRPCPKPSPQPAPEPAPAPEPSPGPLPAIPDIVGPPQDADGSDDASLRLALVAFAVVFVATFVFDKVRASRRA